jgi:amino acid adenylation domain-containing protein/thioester reductase-like protein
MPHRPLVNLITWQTGASPLGVGDRTQQYTTLSFDDSFQEIYATWCSGGTLVLVDEETRRDLTALPGLLAGQAIARLFLPFVALQQLADACCQQGVFPSSLKEVITAGEQLVVTPAVSRLFSELPGCTLHNHYGPTEAHVVTAFRLPSPPSTWTRLPPIGRPIANARVHVLDGGLRSVPVGVPGALYLGGDCLARGYLGQPELTAERFVPDPFTGNGGTLYRTGDLARWLPTGELEFLGRIDSQVKVRGFRVEPGEIEQLLSRHPVVREAVVLAREDRPGDKRLVAYVVPQPEGALTLPEVRAHLGVDLPEHMMPSALVQLDAWPRTPSGKIDRRALPAPEAGPVGEYVAPRTPTEELLARVWAEVLGVERVGAQDNFFDLGGHSLLATQAIARARQALDLDLPLRTLFEAPTVAVLAARIDAARTAGAATHGPPLVPVPRDGELPLSFAQQRLWFLEQLYPDSSVYNLPAALRIQGPLDADALGRTLAEVVRRHEALRTHFASAAGQPVQVIKPEPQLELPLLDLSGLPAAEREAQARRLATEEAARPFDVAAGPLVRARLLRLGQAEHLALLTVHHLVSDGWSVGVLVREAAALYQAFSAGRPSPLPELPVQYADFALWQRQWLQGETLQRLLAYWKRQLAGIPARLDLPADRPRPAQPSGAGAEEPLALPPELTRRLRELALSEQATLFMALLAGFQTLLLRYTGQTDLVVGTPVANRTRPELEQLIGFFVNTLALRTDLSGDPSFVELLSRVRQVAVGAFDHQELPFERLVEELRPERQLGVTPLLQVLFVLQNVPLPATSFGSLRFSVERVESGTAMFDLSLTLVEAPDGGLEGMWEYSTELFDRATVARLGRHFRKLLEGAAADPRQRLSELPLLDEAERQLLLVSWNHTRTDYPRDLCLHQLIEAQAARTPDAVAVAWAEERLSYRELDQRANRLAHKLRGLGVGPEVVVGICLERGPDLVVAILGVLKAGGAFLPLDPAYPADRLAFLVHDARARVLITHQEFLPALPTQEAAVLCLDAPAPVGAANWEGQASRERERPEAGPPPDVTPDNLAYVIYTSGSTGRPKGVMIPHRNVVNLTTGSIRLTGLRPADRVLQFASITFDTAIEELFPALTIGATVVLREESTALSSAELLSLVQRQGVTVLVLPTVCWQQLTVDLTRRPRPLPPSLRLLYVGGEKAMPATSAAWQKLAGARAPWINGYGPTEATVTCIAYQPPPWAEGQEAWAELPIGRPMANRRAYVLDDRLQPVPVGLPGELYIGGVGLARGYLGSPALTASRFVPDPFSREPGARLYRTGDLARWREDGDLEYLGRRDQQVKVRGFRVEPGEVEAVLLQAPRVREAAVLAWEDGPAGPRLVAYVVPDRNGSENGAVASAVSGEALKTHLALHLPPHMIPSAFVILDTMPRTAGDKVDRQALPAPEAARTEGPDPFVAPRTPLEETLAGILAEVLDLERVGIHDSFFDRGGHSLQAMQLVARIGEALNRTVSVRDLFLAPTVARLAETLERQERGESQLPALDLAAEAVLDPTIQVTGLAGEPATEPAHILLTGATGFLGAFLLQELLRETRAHLHCLVRCADAEAGQRKLRIQLQDYGLWDESFASRLTAVPGDLAEPHLGLAPEVFAQLARRVEVIYHNGALVNMVYPYSGLRAANVQGTQEVLRLACTHRVKPVHYVSTLSVFPSPGAGVPDHFWEDEVPASWKDLTDGYSQSKWVAEQLVGQAGARGLPVTVYRPGKIAGHSRTGACSPNDLLIGALHGLVRLGAAPDLDAVQELTPVDYVSRALVYLSRRPGCRGKIYHLTNPNPVSLKQVVVVLGRFGHSLRLLSFPAWRAMALGQNGASPVSGLTGLLPLHTLASTEELLGALRPQHFDCGNTLAALADSDIRCPPGDERLLETYLGYLTRNGLLGPP